jgi:hypothetical protein
MRWREEEVNNINQKAGRVNDKYVDFISRKYTIHKDSEQHETEVPAISLYI